MTRAKDISKITTDANFGGTLDVTGETTLSTHLNMGDNDIIKLGDSADLQIYHDGIRSFIQDVSAGNLILDTFNGNEVNITSGGNAEFMIRAIKDGAVNLYYDNSTYSNPKLATTSTGIDVTGTATMDGLTVDGSGVLATFGNTAGNNSIGVIRTTTSPSSAYLGAFSNTGVIFYSGSGGIKFTNNDTSQDSFKIASNGDISFYEDTGTTAKFFWDASDERLGIGTSSPPDQLSLVNASDSNQFIGFDWTDASTARIRSTRLGAGNNQNLRLDAQDDLINATNGTQRMRISSTGDFQLYEDTGTTPKLRWSASNESLGIGTTTQASILEVIGSKNDNWAGRFENTNTGGYGGLFITAGSTSDETAFEVRKDTTDTILKILGNGDVGIGVGTSSPDYELHVKGSGSGYVRVDNTVAGNSGDVRVSLAKNGTTFGQIGQFSSSDFVISSQTSLGFITNGQNFSNGTRAVTIDTSGNLLVGKTSSGSDVVGNIVNGSGQIYSTPNGSFGLNINRKTSDGDLIVLRKDNSTVGSIGVSSSRIYIVPPTGYGIKVAGNDVRPVTTAGANSDNTLDLGVSFARFKDLYLSGTANMGGLTVAGVVEIDGSAFGNISKQAFTRTDASWSINNETNFRIYGGTGDTTSPSTKRMELATNGDISFYEDTGTTPKLVWKASDEYLGIQTSSPSAPLHINGTSSISTEFKVGNSTWNSSTGSGMLHQYRGSDGYSELQLNSTSTSGSNVLTIRDGSGVSSALYNDGSAYFGGNVGIGTQSPSTLLHLKGDNATILLEDSSPDDVREASLFVQSGDLFLRAGNNLGTGSPTVDSQLVLIDGGTMTYQASASQEAFRVTGSNAHFSVGTTANTYTFNVGDSGSDKRANFQGNNQYRLGLQNGTNDLVWLGSGGANNFRISNAGGSTLFEIDSSGNASVISGTIGATGSYSNTTGAGANVHILSSGVMVRSTSSLRYKNTINDATHGLTELLTLRPITYKGNNDGDTVYGGLIAEEVHDAGLTEFVQYNDEGEPDALAYGNMVSLCIKAIQELKAELDSAKARITALENGE